MQKKLTITIDEEIYDSLHQVIGQRKISKFIENLIRPHFLKSDLEEAYARMAQDKEREQEALEWAENTLGDSFHEEG